MKLGDIVTIYENPLTHDRPEGEAKLIKHLREDKGIANYNFWEVEFIKEPGVTFQRWVYPS